MHHRKLRVKSVVGFLGLIVLLLTIVGGLSLWVAPKTPEQLLKEARTAFAQQNYFEAEQLALGITSDDRQFSAALFVAGRSASMQMRLVDAVGYFDRLPDDGSKLAVQARFLAGDVLLNGLFRLSEAEQRFRQVLKRYPRHIEANQHLVYLLGICGRNRDAIPHRLQLIRQGAFTPTDLLLLALRETAHENADMLAECVRKSPDDPLARLGSAVAAHRLRQPERAVKLLRKLTASAPELIEAQMRLGSLLLEMGRTQEFQEWDRRLTEQAEERPETWALRGDFAQQQGELWGAARCYWESLRCDPCYQRAAWQLGQVLLALQEPELAAPFLNRAVMLQDLLLLMKRRTDQNANTMRDAAHLCEKLGLLWEAWGWSRAASQNDPHSSWARQTLERLTPHLGDTLARVSSDADPTQTVDLSEIPIPHWERDKHAPSRGNGPIVVHNTQFKDEALPALLSFSYFNGSDPSTPPVRPFEFTGGGVAILDYDGDGWPDVYLTQGCVWPHRPDQRDHLDRLFRNLGNGRFEDVTVSAGLAEHRYSQGTTVGDYNNDGHPDLYVANLDANRLFRNQAEGHLGR